MRRGRFIVLEGIDGSGKSEQARRLAAWLAERHTVVSTREPTDGEWGRTYRAWARGEFEASADEVLRWFANDRREHVAKVVAPALERGDVVVCDRYRDSTRAYQAAQGIDRARLAELFAGPEFPAPDLVLWLRVPVATALERLGARAGERFERGDFLFRVDAEYERLGLVPIDASGTPDEVERALRARVERSLVP
ncbi:MAG TPA: dTMP kinase [Myxococcota bacterium]|nr:dTMP kinase [Myxococcota bacterium]